MNNTVAELKGLIRDIPDFPQKGIVFKDITPLLSDENAFSSVIDLIVVHYGRGNIDKVVGIEARGFILSSPIAYHFGAGFVPVRKEGKLPWETESQEYALEYGSAVLEVHKDSIRPGVPATGAVRRGQSMLTAGGERKAGWACRSTWHCSRPAPRSRRPGLGSESGSSGWTPAPAGRWARCPSHGPTRCPWDGSSV